MKIWKNYAVHYIFFNIIEKILNFDKQQKGKGLKILTPKQML